MRKDSYLDAEAIKEQCAVAVRNLESDNAALKAAEYSLKKFLEDGELKGAATAALKQQAADYAVVAQMLRDANCSDIRDFRKLAEAVGEETLNGEAILSQQENSLEGRSGSLAMAQRSADRASASVHEYERLHYMKQAEMYDRLADTFQLLYMRWKEKEEAYDRIESVTRGLFTEGEETRAVAGKALSVLECTHAYGGVQYCPDTGNGWRKELEELYISRVFAIAGDRKAEVDWEALCEMLSGEAGDITDAEYHAAARAYLSMDEEDAGRFICLLMGRGGDMYWSPAHGALDTGTYISCTEWEADREKINKLMDCLAEEAQRGLEEMRRGEGDASMQNRILQRNTLLGVVLEIGIFRGDYQGEGPRLYTEAGKDGLVTLYFYEEKRAGELGEYTTYGPSHVSIHATEAGLGLGLEQLEAEHASYVGFFCGGSGAGEEIVGYAAGEAVGEMLEYAAGEAPEFMAKGATKLMGLVSLGWEIAEDWEERKETREFLDAQYDAKLQLEILKKYCYYVNIVDYDTSEGKGMTVYGYEGYHTAEVVTQTNEVFAEYGGRCFTVEEVVKNPAEVCAEYMKCIDGNDEAKHKFNDA